MSRPLQRKPISLYLIRRKPRAKRLPSLRFDIMPGHYSQLAAGSTAPFGRYESTAPLRSPKLPIRPLEGAPREEQQGRLTPPLPLMPVWACFSGNGFKRQTTFAFPL